MLYVKYEKAHGRHISRNTPITPLPPVIPAKNDLHNLQPAMHIYTQLSGNVRERP